MVRSTVGREYSASLSLVSEIPFDPQPVFSDLVEQSLVCDVLLVLWAVGPVPITLRCSRTP